MTWWNKIAEKRGREIKTRHNEKNTSCLSRNNIRKLCEFAAATITTTIENEKKLCGIINSTQAHILHIYTLNLFHVVSDFHKSANTIEEIMLNAHSIHSNQSKRNETEQLRFIV